VQINSNKNRIYSITCDYYPDVKVKTNPDLNENDIKAIVSSTFAGEEIKITGDPELWIKIYNGYTDNESYGLVYKVMVKLSDPRDERQIIIDANTGNILSNITATKRYFHATGSGKIYEYHKDYGSLETKDL